MKKIQKYRKCPALLGSWNSLRRRLLCTVGEVGEVHDGNVQEQVQGGEEAEQMDARAQGVHHLETHRRRVQGPKLPQKIFWTATGPSMTLKGPSMTLKGPSRTLKGPSTTM